METIITTDKGGGFTASKTGGRQTTTPPVTKDMEAVTTEKSAQSLADAGDKTTISENGIGALKATQTTQSSLAGASSRVDYSVDGDNNVVLQVIDSETDEVIRSIPPEEQTRITKALDKILEQSSHQDSKGPQDSSIEDTI